MRIACIPISVRREVLRKLLLLLRLLLHQLRVRRCQRVLWRHSTAAAELLRRRVQLRQRLLQT